MKRYILSLLLIILALSAECRAQSNSAQPDSALCTLHSALNKDSIRVSLLTCGAYDELWTLYGHSALRIQMPLRGEDIVANYGVFDFRQPNFIGRFVFGKCDYMMALMTFDDFMREFSFMKASVVEQEINLTQPQKERIREAVYINSLPENCVYRYNFLYDNCCTRPRDIILNNISDSIVYNNVIDTDWSFRRIIHSCNYMKSWSRMGNDLLMGMPADFHTDRADQQFLPKNLMRDFAEAEFIDSAGHRRPVVLRSTLLLRDGALYAGEFPLSPFHTMLIFFALCLAVCLYEYWRKRKGKKRGAAILAFDITIFTVAGLLGLILFVMIFSEHPTVSLNFQILVLNPLYIFLLWRVIPEMLGRRKPRALLCLLVCGLLALIADTLIQEFAEGMLAVTAALLLRLRSYLVAPKKE